MTTKMTNTILELEAIDAVRLELKQAKLNNVGPAERYVIEQRLVSLYLALGVDNIISIISEIEYRKKAA